MPVGESAEQITTDCAERATCDRTRSGTVPVMGTSGGRRAVGDASLPRSVLSGIRGRQ